MGIYLSEINMPKGEGSKLVLQIFPSGEVYDEHGFRLGIANWAEAVPVPPHGRLGDLDALTHTIERVDWYHQNEEKDMVHGANSFLHQAWYKEQDIYEAIENAPTIISAEGGENK